MQYAYVRDDVVQQLFAQDPAWPAELEIVKVPDAVAENWVRQANGSFTAPAPPASAAVRLSFLQFMDLFTDAEQLAIAGAAMTDAPTKLWYDRAVGAQFIALDDPRLAAGLRALVEAELITAARHDRVLAGLAPED